MPDQSATTRRTSIVPYRAGLVDELEQDHRVLLERLLSVLQAVDAGEHDASMVALAGFTAVLRTHLLKEHLFLYAYLRGVLREDGDSAHVIASMLTDMQRVGRALNDFTRRCMTPPADDVARARLREELARVGTLLAHRIRQEESVLYPIYAARAPVART